MLNYIIQSEFHLNTYHFDENLLFQFIFSEFLIINEQLDLLVKKPISKKKIKELTITIVGQDNNHITSFKKLYKYILIFSKMHVKNAHLLNVTIQLVINQLEKISKEEVSTSVIEETKKAWNNFKFNMKLLIPQFLKNENVILFLLRHQHSIAKIYGDKFLRDLLLKKFEKNVLRYLEKKYAKRGFETLIPLIRIKLEELNG